MNIKFFSIIFVSFLISCSTFEFGVTPTIDSLYEDEKQQIKTDISRYNLEYRHFLGKNVVSKGNSVAEDIFIGPDNQTHFVIISFPKIGILRTSDEGETFDSTFFDLPSLCTHFGYATTIDNSPRENGETKETIPDFNRIIPKFGYNPDNHNQIFISMGDYIFTSSDFGNSWTYKKLFYDNDKTKILNVIVTKSAKLVAFAENKISISADWGKKWKNSYLKLPAHSPINAKFVDSIYNKSNDTMYLSIINNKFGFDIYSRNSYEFFYQNKNVKNEIALVYKSSDEGKTWTKTNICIPVCFFQQNENTYFCSVFPTDLYDQQFNSDFCKDEFYQKANLVTLKKSYSQYLDYLQNPDTDKLQILSKSRSNVCLLQDSNYCVITDPDFDILFSGFTKLQTLDFVQFVYKYFDKNKSNSFCYEYNQFHTFKRWTAMKTNNPILYTKDKSTFYRMIPNPKFWSGFAKYALDNQARINSINPFLKKMSDIEFINPELDKTGLPILLQKSIDNGQTWQTFGDYKHLSTVIDPLNSKRSGFFWYKNVEQKKNLKLQFSFGREQGINYIQYPNKIIANNGKLYILLNYFTFTNSYKDLYIINL